MDNVCWRCCSQQVQFQKVKTQHCFDLLSISVEIQEIPSWLRKRAAFLSGEGKGKKRFLFHQLSGSHFPDHLHPNAVEGSVLAAAPVLPNTKCICLLRDV